MARRTRPGPRTDQESGEGSDHDDEVERNLEDHRGSQGAYSSARQPDRPVMGAADENDNDEDGSYGCQGNGRDGIRWPGVGQVIAACLLGDDPDATNERCHSSDPGCEHKVRGFLAGSWCPDRQRQPGPRIRRTSRGDQQHEGEHDPGGAAIADPYAVVSHVRCTCLSKVAGEHADRQNGPSRLRACRWMVRLTAGQRALVGQAQAGYQLGHLPPVAGVVVGELGQHEPFLDADLELQEHEVHGEGHDPPPGSG